MHTLQRLLWPRNSILLVILLAITCSVAQAAHSRRRQAARFESSPRYDRSITTFSPEGRLLQVEYGMEASSRGEAIAAILHPDGIVLAVGSTAAAEKVHRIDAHVYLITAGLAPDGRYLAYRLRIACQTFRLQNGEAPTVREVAVIAARLQHDMTKTGGARPFGCTAVILGIDASTATVSGIGHDDGDHSSLVGQPRLFQTDPGGIMEECFYCAAGKGRSQVMKDLGDLHDRVRPNKRKKLPETARDLALSVIGVQEKASDGPKTISIWTIRPHQHRRGETETIWIDHVHRKNAKKLQLLLEQL